MRDRAQTAYHESGHAVAAFLCGHRILPGGVSILPSGGSIGRCYSDGLRGVKPDVDAGDRVSGRIERTALVCLAGRAAEKKYRPRSRFAGCRSDYDKAFKLLSYLDEGEALGLHFHLIEVRARALVNTNWRIVGQLAEELLTRGHMPGREVSAYLRAAITRAAGARD